MHIVIFRLVSYEVVKPDFRLTETVPNSIFLQCDILHSHNKPLLFQVRGILVLLFWASGSTVMTKRTVTLEEKRFLRCFTKCHAILESGMVCERFEPSR